MAAFLSFDFVNHPWWRMVDASISIFVSVHLCIILVDDHINSWFFIWPFLGMAFPINFSSFWELLFCSICSKLPWQQPDPPGEMNLHHQWSRAGFDSSKQD